MSIEAFGYKQELIAAGLVYLCALDRCGSRSTLPDPAGQ